VRRAARRVWIGTVAAAGVAGASLLMRRELLNALLYFPSAALEATPADAGLRYSDVEVTTEDGERLHGWWVPTTRPPSKAHVLHLHGNAGNISFRIPQARLLAEAGFDVFLVDYRGYGRSTGRPDEEGTYRDARAARAALVKFAGVDPARIVYLGESLGGAVAVALAIESPPRALILQSTFSSIKSMARRHYPLVPGVLVVDAYPTLDRIPRVEAPVLVVHGDRDDIVPLAEGQALLAAAREPKRLWIVNGAGHNDLVDVAGAEYGRVVSEWLETLPAR
jgi:hypothetical protein